MESPWMQEKWKSLREAKATGILESPKQEDEWWRKIRRTWESSLNAMWTWPIPGVSQYFDINVFHGNHSEKKAAI